MIDGLEAALGMIHVWLKAGHVIFVVFWMAAMFMLPRFYVYHQEAKPGSDEERKWVERERKLRKIIMTPSMILVWVFGLSLAWITHAWSEHWFQAKFVLVLLLSAYHGWMVGYGRKLARGDRSMSGKALRIMNEVPGLFAVLIIVLVIVRPF